MHLNLKICSAFWRITVTHYENIGNIYYTMLFFFNLTLNVIFQYLTLYYLIYRSAEMDISDLSRALESYLILFHGFISMVFLYIQRGAIGDLIAKSKDLDLIDHIKDEALKASCKRTLKEVQTLFIVYILLCNAAALSTFFLRPITSRGKYLILIGYIPFHIPFALVALLQLYTYVTAIHLTIISFDGAFLTVTMLVKVQFKILNHDLKALFDEDLTEAEIIEKSGKWVERHNDLLELLKQTATVVSLPVLLYSGMITFGMCFELYIIFIVGNYAAVPYFLAAIFDYIICYCVPAQLVIDEAAKVTENAWESKWYKHPSRTIRTTMNMILMRSQKPVVINAVIVPINLTTCQKTLKTMISYYMFLRTVGLDEE